MSITDNNLKDNNILLIITGSVSCYKSLILLRKLKEQGYNIRIIITKSAENFITKQYCKFLNDNECYNDDDMFIYHHQNNHHQNKNKHNNSQDDIQDDLSNNIENNSGMLHLILARNNDKIIIYPATANIIGKIAHGIADDLATSSILASECKNIYICPAMNPEMYNNNFVRDNIKKLRLHNYNIIGPDTGKSCCNEYGECKLVAPEKIQDLFLVNDEIATNFTDLELTNIKQYFANKSVLITGGRTIEKIDPVRYISNFSSGKQSIALVKIISKFAKHVYYIYGEINNELESEIVNNNIDKNINFYQTKSAEKMLETTTNILQNNKIDIGIFCAAVCDYKIDEYNSKKIKKNNSNNCKLELTTNPDILDYVGQSKLRPEILIGFCAETDNLLENIIDKINKKNCDIMIGNYIQINNNVFNSEDNKITIINKKNLNKKFTSEKTSKINIATQIIKQIFYYHNKKI